MGRLSNLLPKGLGEWANWVTIGGVPLGLLVAGVAAIWTGPWILLAGGGLGLIISAIAYVLRLRRRSKQPPLTPIPDLPPAPTIVFRAAPPPREPHFVGREEELEKAVTALRDDKPVNIHGMPGIGKSTLAAEVAADERIGRRFTQGIWWMESVGSSSLSDLCDAVARAAGQMPVLALAKVAEKKSALRAWLYGKSLLIVLDNADNAEVARAFCLEVHPQTLVTSRPPVDDLEPVPLGVLPLDKSIELLQKEAEAQANRSIAPAEEPLLGEIAGLVECHPLALALAGGQLRGMGASQLLASLRTARLDPLYDPNRPDRAVRITFASSYRSLPTDEHRLLFAALGAFGGSDFDLPAMQAAHPPATAAMLSDLVRRSLVRFRDGRYSLHLLLREYAREKLGGDEAPFWRMAGYFLEYAQAHPQATPQDYDALERELTNILFAMDWCHGRMGGEGDEARAAAATAVATMDAVQVFLNRRGHWAERVSYGGKALEAAQALGDQSAIARISGNLAIAHQDQGRYQEAERVHKEVLQIYRELGDERNQAAALHQLGMLAHDQGRYGEAEGLYKEGLEAFEELGAQAEIAAVKHQLGMLAQDQGRYGEAEGLYNASLEIKRRLGNQAGIAYTLGQLGNLALARGDMEAAKSNYEQCLDISRKLGDQAGIAITLHQLGMLAQAQARYGEAEGLYNESLEIKRRLGDQAGIAITLHQLGNLAYLQGRYPEAQGLYNESLEIKRRLGDQSGIASTLHQLGMLAYAQGRYGEAEGLYNESLEIARRLGNQSGIASTLHQLGVLAQAQGRNDEAKGLYNESLEIKRRLGNQAGIAITLHQLGMLAEEAGDLEPAAQLFQQALEIFERLGSPDAEVARRSLERVRSSASGGQKAP